jgi:hypothetical protein
MTETEPDQVVASQQQWRAGRRYLDEHRHELSGWAARNLYPDHPRVAGTGLLTRQGWIPEAPVPLENVGLTWCDTWPGASVDGSEPESERVRPLRADGGRYATYADAVDSLARPRLFEDRPCYRFLDLRPAGGRVDLGFGMGTYFDVINTCEAVAHELADARRRGQVVARDLPLRSLIGDPCDLARRGVMVAISALTLRRAKVGTTFVLHRRDSAQVAHGGGLYQVMPVGVFQPSGPGAHDRQNDFDLWRSMAREYSEEFLGAPERRGIHGPLDYGRWDFFRELAGGREAGTIAAHWLGVGVDPLSLVTDLLVAVVFDDEVYDGLFSGSVAVNAEGDVVGHHRFDEDQVSQMVASAPMQAAGAAALALAWQGRATLLAED